MKGVKTNIDRVCHDKIVQVMHYFVKKELQTESFKALEAVREQVIRK